MYIDKERFTKEAVSIVKIGEAYDREDVSQEVAKSIAYGIYNELGGVRAMSLQDVECMKSAFYTAAKSLIDWTRCNRKVNPDEYADMAWRMNDPEERL